MFDLEIKTGGAAFRDENGEEDKMSECFEVARILRNIADSLEDGLSASNILDINGNTVGSFKFTY